MPTLSPLEMNIGHSALAYVDLDTADALAALSQGDAHCYFGSVYARLTRKWGSGFAAEAHVYQLAWVLSFVDVAARKLPFDKRADLLNFIIERGVNMEPRA
jgi:urease accessory protein UreF